MKKLKFYKLFGSLICIISIISVGFMIYSLYLLSGIETFYRIMACALLLLLLILFLYSIIDSIRFYKKKKFIAYSIFSVMISIVCVIGAYLILTVYGKINNFNKTELLYNSYLVSINEQESIDKIKDLKIGIIDDEENIEGYLLPLELIDKYDIETNNTIVKYSDYIMLLTDLIEGNIDVAFISSNYENMLNNIENSENINLLVINKYSKEYKKEDVEDVSDNTTNRITKPFTMLLLGIDSTESSIDSSTSFNGDTIMLLSVDPETLSVTMFSIPRDTYVTMGCGGNITKITHAAWGGTSCMVKTVEKLTGLNVDYYAKVNFTGVVDLVDSLGGVSVDIPKAFCEQDSKRQFGDHLICLETGYQQLNGEQALAFARHRKTLILGDFQRGQNQQALVVAMINKLKTVRSVNDFIKILDTVSVNIDTNMTTDEILSLYNVGKSVLLKSKDVNLNITRTYLTGYDLTVYEGNSSTYTFQYYRQSLESIVNAMKENLGLKEKEVIKSFDFSIKEPYEKVIVGKNYYNETRKALVPNLLNYTLEEAKTWANANDIALSITEVESDESYYSNNQIAYQTVHAGALVEKTNSITIHIIKKISSETNTKPISNPSEEGSSVENSNSSEEENPIEESNSSEDEQDSINNDEE